MTDSSAREALMVVRSESFRLFEMNNDRFEELVGQISDLGKQVAVLVKALDGKDQRDDQWKQSATRVFEDFKVQLREHAKDDEEYQEKSDKRWSSAQVWMIGTLLTLVGSSWTVIGILIWAKLK